MDLVQKVGDIWNKRREQIVNKEKSEAIADMIASLANEEGSVTNPLSKIGDETNDEVGAVEIQKSDDSPALSVSAEDNLKRDKIEDTQTREDGAKAEPDVSVEKTDDPLSLEAHIEDNLKEVKEVIPALHATEKVEDKIQEPEKESEAEVVKEAETLVTSDQKEEKLEHEAVALIPEIREKTEEPEEKSQEKLQEAEQRTTVTITEPFTEVNTIEEKTRELSEDILKETNDSEAVPTETAKAEPVVPEVEENLKESEKESLEQKEEKQPNMIAIAQVSSETIEVIEEKASEPEVLNETNNYEIELTEAERAELEVTKVDENSSEPEKKSFKQEEEELPKTVIPETATTGDIVKVQPPKESDIEVVKETGTTELEAVPVREEKSELVHFAVEEKPRELVEVAEDVRETKEVESKQEIVLETAKNEVTSADTIKEKISLKEEKTDKEDETSITENTAQISLNEEARAAPENLVEYTREVTEKVVEEVDKNKSSFTDVIEGVRKDEGGILKIPGQASIDQEAKTDIEERGYSIPTSVEEKVAITVDDDKKEPKAPGSVQVSSREAEDEIDKDEKQIEVKTATTEDDGPAVKNEKGGHTDKKVDEIFSAVSEPVRETLASKFEEKETTKTEVDNLEKEQTEEPVKTEFQVPEEPTKESDATKTSSKDLPKESPAKTAQKHSNNIISKVKQSLVKARKAIIGKSPSSKNHSTEAKDDIQVK
ncbi:hypothetical protein Lal_00048989 [Lupinus albus]|uniref:Uncharacterized protein n=1 Tax=Lupinus albus TaxID=3870 RepID=A0A6A5NB40_LUPAL|nr:hypothetical protein Lalb_Chr06g0167251 [Lupinus albus]KAF1880352.1 hypothetical protein Lal_00048989 [Lupinus albus]